jgi:hypothetical protein
MPGINGSWVGFGLESLSDVIVVERKECYGLIGSSSQPFIHRPTFMEEFYFSVCLKTFMQNEMRKFCTSFYDFIRGVPTLNLPPERWHHALCIFGGV